jgi:hypothetical protein
LFALIQRIQRLFSTLEPLSRGSKAKYWVAVLLHPNIQKKELYKPQK